MEGLVSDETETMNVETNDNKEEDLSGTNKGVSSEKERVLSTLFVDTSSKVLVAIKGPRRLSVINIP